jgi:hypothetical protein
VKIACLSLTRDRLYYSQTCFASLYKNAGCDYDHYVLDQGSQDDTPRWLLNGTFHEVHLLKENIGISKGLNFLLDRCADQDYDVIIKYDNDCELVTPNTVCDIAALTLESGWILGPVMSGYGTPLVNIGETQLGDYRVNEVQQIQGCFLAATAEFYKGFRYNENNPTWGMDDPEVCAFIRLQGGHVGQVLGYHANHYESTEGQEERYPDYFRTKVAEGLPWP